MWRTPRCLPLYFSAYAPLKILSSSCRYYEDVNVEDMRAILQSHTRLADLDMAELARAFSSGGQLPADRPAPTPSPAQGSKRKAAA